MIKLANDLADEGFSWSRIDLTGLSCYDRKNNHFGREAHAALSLAGERAAFLFIGVFSREEDSGCGLGYMRFESVAYAKR